MAEMDIREKVPTVDILGLPIHQVARGHLLPLVEKRHQAGLATWIVTANAELVMAAKSKRQVATALGKAHLRLADGAGVVWAGRRLGCPSLERMPGVEIAEELVAWTARRGLTVYMLGAKPGVAEEAVGKLNLKYPGLRVAGCHHGYFGDDQEEDIMEEIQLIGPDLLLVALGAPRQELWLARHFPKLKAAIAVGVGGSFDIWSGQVRRAPAWMGERGLEWLYRLLQEPSRGKRMLALPRFVWCVLWHHRRLSQDAIE